MENKDEKVQKDIKDEAEQPENISEPLNNEQEILEALKYFETERRKDFEKTLKSQRRALEAQLRGEKLEIELSNKDYKIMFAVISSRIKEQPIFGYSFDVDRDFNEFAYASFLNEKMDNYFKSKEYREFQKREYYRLRKQGMKPSDIFPLIEARWSVMDSKEKTNFRSMLREFYTRKERQNDNKSDKKLSSS